MNWFEPLDFTNQSHIQGAEVKMQFFAGWFANPILVNGDYPSVMRKMIDYQNSDMVIDLYSCIYKLIKKFFSSSDC